MLAKVYSCAVVGLEGAVAEVEADLNPRALALRDPGRTARRRGQRIH